MKWWWKEDWEGGGRSGGHGAPRPPAPPIFPLLLGMGWQWILAVGSAVAAGRDRGVWRRGGGDAWCTPPPRLQAPRLRLGMGWRWRWDVGNGLVKGEGRWGVGTGGWGTRSQDRPDLLRTTVQSMNRRSLPQMRALPAILRASKNISSCVKLAGPANDYYYYYSAVN